MTRASAIGGTGRQTLLLLAVAVAVATAFGILRLQSGEAAADTATATVTRGELTVTVGGVGRIVQARASTELTVPAGSSGASARSSGTTSASADAVFPRVAGRVSRYLVSPGQRVVAGQPLAVIDDGGTTVTAVGHAKLDLSTALLELRQKQTHDPLRGFPATPAEFAAAGAAVRSAQARLGRLQSPPRRADVAAAQLDVRRAQAELETLRGGSPAARAASIDTARQSVQLAQSRLDRILQPASVADVKVAEAELKRAEAELAVLRRPQLTPSPEALAAAQLAVNNARADLARSQQAGDSELIREAHASLDSALADLNILLRPGPTALPQQVAAAEAAIDSARTRLERLQAPPNSADVAAARNELERAEAELRLRKAAPGAASVAAAQHSIVTARTRLQQLLGPPHEADVRGARFDVRRAQAELAVLKSRGGPASAVDISLAQSKVTSARLRLSAAQLTRRLLTVTAPWNGTVTSLLAVRGAPVDMTTPVVAVADLSRLSASVDLSEFDAALVRQGQKAVISVDALGGRSFPGRVTYASPTGTNAGGVVIFPVQVGLTRSKGLKPGMNVSVRIVVARRQNVLQLPVDAVTRDGEGRPVVTLVSDDGEATRRVKLGLANNQNVQILAGLEPGDEVAVGQPAAEEGGDEAEEEAGA